MSETIIKTSMKASAGDDEARTGLRRLWHETFGDSPEYIDAFFENFGDDISAYAMVDEAGSVCSALSCYRCGTYLGRPVYVSYAICTREDRRGQGLAGELTAYVRDKVMSEGGISVVSPAEPSLIGFYEKLGYVPFFCASERAVLAPDFNDDDFEDADEFDLDIGGGSSGFRCEIDMQRISADTYNRHREAFLSECPHIELSADMLRLVESESRNGCGLYSVNRGDAICVIGDTDVGRTFISELIVSPVLMELSLDIDIEIASLIAKHFGSTESVYRTPGGGYCQTMAAGLPTGDEADEHEEQTEDGWSLGLPPYFGFPID